MVGNDEPPAALALFLVLSGRAARGRVGYSVRTVCSYSGQALRRGFARSGSDDVNRLHRYTARWLGDDPLCLDGRAQIPSRA